MTETTAQTKLLIADDDTELCELLSEYLTCEGFTVSCVHDGESALVEAGSGEHHALILDIMLPKLNGLEVLQMLRQSSDIPIIMLTARGDEVDRVVGLEVGADDYLPKPCSPRELVAHLKAVLRRTQSAIKNTSPSTVKQDTITIGQFCLRLSSRKVTLYQKQLALTSTEFNVLHVLMRDAGSIVTKEDLTFQALGRKLTAYDRSIDVHISNIRKKIAQIDSEHEWVINLRGVGYQFIILEGEDS